MLRDLMMVLELFIVRVKSPEFLRDGVVAILTMNKIELADTLWNRQYVEDADKILGWLVVPPQGAGYPLLNQNDLMVREFLCSAYRLADELFDAGAVRQFAADVCDLLIGRGRYLMAKEWCTLCGITEPTDAQLANWAKHLKFLGAEKAAEVVEDYLEFPSAVGRFQMLTAALNGGYTVIAS